MASLVLDTDVASFLFKGDSRASLYDPFLGGRVLVLSFMTLAELDQWALKRRWGKARKARMDEYLGRYVIYPFDRELCRCWAEVKYLGDRRGRPIETADAWIAATALVANISLLTHNPTDFAGVDGLTVLTAARQ